MASKPDPSDPPPLVLDGIDVSFCIPEAGLSTAHPLPAGTPNGNGHARAVRQRTSGVDDVATGGTEESCPPPKSAGVNNQEETQKVGVPLRADQAEICDLLAGYFRYFAEDFRHITQVSVVCVEVCACFVFFRVCGSFSLLIFFGFLCRSFFWLFRVYACVCWV